HRPVQVCSAPRQGIEDIAVDTRIEGASGLVRVRAASGDPGATFRFRLSGFGFDGVQESRGAGGAAEVEIPVPQPELWAPGNPALYTLTVEQLDGGAPVDRYTMSVGVRTVSVDGHALLLNGKPVYLKGFGRHEDFPVTGRGLVPAVIVKDYSLMEWV